MIDRQNSSGERNVQLPQKPDQTRGQNPFTAPQKPVAPKPPPTKPSNKK